MEALVIAWGVLFGLSVVGLVCLWVDRSMLKDEIQEARERRSDYWGKYLDAANRAAVAEQKVKSNANDRDYWVRRCKSEEETCAVITADRDALAAKHRALLEANDDLQRRLDSIAEIAARMQD